MLERFNRTVLKTVEPSRVPRVRPSIRGAPGVCRANLELIMYYVYILISLKDKRFYIGYTEDLKRRYKEHSDGRVESTKNRLPMKLVCYEAYSYKGEALLREKFLKSSDGKKDLRRRLNKSLEF